MSEHDHIDDDRSASGGLLILLRGTEPPEEHRAAEVAPLWAAGRRRARRARGAWVAGWAAIVVLVVALVASTLDRPSDVSVQVADSVPGFEPEADATDPELNAAVPEPGPTQPPDAAGSTSPGFPISMRVDRDVVEVDGDPDVEVGFLPVDPETREEITVAIPFTIDAWDAGSSAWAPVIDLYDQSRASMSYWQPHASGPAWYEWTSGTWGFPLNLPVQDLPAGGYRICAQAWRAADGPARPDDGTEPFARSLPELTVPPASVRLCVPLQLVEAPGASVDPGSAFGTPNVQIDRLGVVAPLLPATMDDLSVGVGLLDGSPAPGEPGIAIVVGHRTTWMAPFLDLDQLVPGDRIRVGDGERRRGEFEVVSSRVVNSAGPVEAPTFGIPSDELAQDGDPTPRLRLVTFDPRYSAAQRLIVDAVLVEPAGS